MNRFGFLFLKLGSFLTRERARIAVVLAVDAFAAQLDRCQQLIIIGCSKPRFLQQRNQPLFGEVRVLFNFAVCAVAYARVSHKLQKLAAFYVLRGNYADKHTSVYFSGSSVLFGVNVSFCGDIGRFWGDFPIFGRRLLHRGLRLCGNVRKFDFLRFIFGWSIGFCGDFG